MKILRRILLRTKAAIEGAVFGWNHPYDFDYGTALDALCWQLKRIEKHIRTHNLFIGSEQQAQNIRRFLILLEDYNNSYERVPRTQIQQEWLEAPFKFKRRRFTPKQKAEGRAWLSTVAKFEKNVWDEAWTLFKDNIRSWWC